MALNPALAKIVSAAKAKHEAKDEQARELLHNLICNELERIHATPSGELVDYPHEATVLLDVIEHWCVGRHEYGYLIFRDPADDVEVLEAAAVEPATITVVTPWRFDGRDAIGLEANGEITVTRPGANKEAAEAIGHSIAGALLSAISNAASEAQEAARREADEA